MWKKACSTCRPWFRLHFISRPVSHVFHLVTDELRSGRMDLIWSLCASPLSVVQDRPLAANQ